MKRWIAALLACMTVLSLAACGQGASQGSTSGAGSAGGQDASSGPVMTIKFSHNYVEDSPAQKAALAFKDYVETQSKGSMKVDIYPAMQLGSNREQLEGIQQGSIQVGLQPTSIVGNFVPEFQILDLPFVFPSEDVFWKVVDGDFGDYLLGLLADKGIHGLGYAWTGFKQITSSKPVSDLASLKGQKIRVMDSPLLLAQYEGWGANPTPIDFSELYNALQQKVVDGEENNYWTVSSQKYYEVQKYMIESNHAPLPALYMCNEQWYDGLTPDQKAIIDAAGELCTQTDREQLRIYEQQAIETVKASGMEIYKLNDDEVKEFQTASQSVYDYAKKNLGEDLYNKLMAAVTANS